jgi:hypothetical protein
MALPRAGALTTASAGRGRLSGQALERVVELTRHPLPRGALDPALQPLELRALDRCGQLQEPHGCAIIEEPDQITAVGLGSQAPQGLQHRAVGLPGPEAHHTLGAHEGGLRSPGEALHEQLDKGGLPGPRLTCHEDELTPALVGFQEAIHQVLDLSPPPHDRLFVACRGPDLRLICRAVEARAHFRPCEEAIAAPGHGLEIRRARRVIAQRGADLTHRDAERGVADMGSAPDLFTKLILGDQASGPACQVGQNTQALRAKRHLLRAPPQPVGVCVEPKSAEFDRFANHSRCLSRQPPRREVEIAGGR